MKRIPLFLVLTFSLASCSFVSAKDDANFVGGKFVFTGMREGVGPQYMNAYLSQKGKLRKVSASGFYPSWSNDGLWVATKTQFEKKIEIHDVDGQLIKVIECPYYPFVTAWSSDNKKIYYVGGEAKVHKFEDLFRIMVYDFETGSHQELKLFQQDEDIFKLYLSPDGRLVLLHIASVINPKVEDYLYLFDLSTNGLKRIHPKGNVLGWFPDGHHIALETNTDPSGKWMNTPHGVLAKLDVETGEFEILRNQTFEALDTTLSKDGKYLYYSRSIPQGGQAIFVRSVETDKEIQITKPIRLPDGRYSKDTYPDWYQSA